MLYIIGLGLADEKDITVKGLEAVRKCDEIFLEAYTSLLLTDKSNLESFYGKPVIVADRDMVETDSDRILRNAKDGNVAFLVVGDPLGATTHTDMIIRANELSIPWKVIHNASIMNAAGACGLQLYKFGQTVSIPFFTESWKPDSFYSRIKENQNLHLHTLCLLDIKVKEQSIENILKQRKIYEPPRFMTVNQALEQLLEIEAKLGDSVITEDSMVVGLGRVGSDEQKIIYGKVKQFLENPELMGPTLHSLIIPDDVHELEKELLNFYSIKC